MGTSGKGMFHQEETGHFGRITWDPSDYGIRFTELGRDDFD